VDFSSVVYVICLLLVIALASQSALVAAQYAADETKIASNYQAEVQKSDLLNADLNAQIIGLQKENTDLVAKGVADVKACKAEGKKNSVKWFKRGLGIGFIAGLFAGHAGL